MAETFSYTYNDLYNYVIDEIKSKFVNIDRSSTYYSDFIANIYKLEDSVEYKVKGTNQGESSNELEKGAIAQGYRLIESKPTLILKNSASELADSLPAPVKSTELESYLQTAIKTYCGCTELTEKVTAKGMLAFFNFLIWFLKNGVTNLHYFPEYTDNKLLLTLPSTSNYGGVSRGSEDHIKASDFSSIVWTISNIAKVNTTLVCPANFSCYWSETSSSSCCSSSSCSSSSCSSSCSSSSCSSSSSSSYFIAYMKLA